MEKCEDSARAVGDIPAGLFIVCCKDSEQRVDGFLASWIQQVSFEPLRISLCIKEGRPAFDLISRGEVFTINIVGDHDRSFLKHFWKGYDPKENPFEKDVEFFETEKNGIVLKKAKSAIECKMVENIDVGDHHLILADVLNSYVCNEQSKSMVHLRKSGRDY